MSQYSHYINHFLSHISHCYISHIGYKTPFIHLTFHFNYVKYFISYFLKYFYFNIYKFYFTEIYYKDIIYKLLFLKALLQTYLTFISIDSQQVYYSSFTLISLYFIFLNHHYLYFPFIFHLIIILFIYLFIYLLIFLFRILFLLSFCSSTIQFRIRYNHSNFIIP